MTEGRRYTEEEIKVITKVCIEGVAALWKSSQLTNRGHGNLTPSSVFLTKEGTYKLGSFNSALAFKKERTPYACYLHPRTGKDTVDIIETDFFAIGMLIYQLIALNNQAMPTLNTSKANTRSQWRSFNYTDGSLEEIWIELIETNKTTSSTDRIFKLSNILKNFPMSFPSAVAPHLATYAHPQHQTPGHTHSSSYPIPAAFSVLPAGGPQQLSHSQTSSEQQAPYSDQFPHSNPLPYQQPPQPSAQLNPSQPVQQHAEPMNMCPAQRTCENCKAAQFVSAYAAGFICRICLHVSRVVPD
jgi:hypothetical protein